MEISLKKQFTFINEFLATSGYTAYGIIAIDKQNYFAFLMPKKQDIFYINEATDIFESDVITNSEDESKITFFDMRTYMKGLLNGTVSFIESVQSTKFYGTESFLKLFSQLQKYSNKCAENNIENILREYTERQRSYLRYYRNSDYINDSYVDDLFLEALFSYILIIEFNTTNKKYTQAYQRAKKISLQTAIPREKYLITMKEMLAASDIILKATPNVDNKEEKKQLSQKFINLFIIALQEENYNELFY